MHQQLAGGVDLHLWFASQEQRKELRAQREAVRSKLDVSGVEREDLAWARRSYVEGFLFGYDSAWMSSASGPLDVDRYLDDGEREFGGYDLLVLWQPYPRMGIDQRSQIDFWRDWPGGRHGLRDMIARCHARGVRCILNHVRWDLSRPHTWEADMRAYGQMLAEVDADGMYLDTLRIAPSEVRAALDAIRPGLLIETEYNAPLAAMALQSMSWSQGHNPEPLSPFIQSWLEPRYMMRMVNRGTPDHRSLVARALFWGHGICVWENVFGWWNPMRAASRAMLQKAATLLRAYHDFYLDRTWEPLERMLAPGVYGNRFSHGGRTLITVLNTRDEAVPTVRVPVPAAGAAYDVWNGRRLNVIEDEGREVVIALEPLGCGCIVLQDEREAAPVFAPVRQVYDLHQDMHVEVHPTEAGALRITRSTGRAVEEITRTAAEQQTFVHETDFRTRVTERALAPRPAGRAEWRGEGEPDGMAHVAGGRLVMSIVHTSRKLEGGCYGDPQSMHHPIEYHWIEPFWMDRTEVTQAAYAEFLASGTYRPADLWNFLRDWQKPDAQDVTTWRPRQGRQRHPVTWVDLEDARAYARWAGKRLPTEAQWQWAAQGPDGRKWPWGEAFDGKRCNHDTAETTPVDAFPQGTSPFGVLDLAGNVWEWTESERHDGHTRSAILRGGSHLVHRPGNHPEAWGKMWYTADGAQANDSHQKMLLMSPGLDRCGTIGFRCVLDGRV